MKKNKNIAIYQKTQPVPFWNKLKDGKKWFAFSKMDIALVKVLDKIKELENE